MFSLAAALNLRPPQIYTTSGLMLPVQEAEKGARAAPGATASFTPAITPGVTSRPRTATAETAHLEERGATADRFY